MAVRIDRVEREFILGSAAETGIVARLRAAGKSLKCRVSTLGAGSVGFSTSGPERSFAPRELVSVTFDFRGQAVAFEAKVLKSASGSLELALPEAMYRSLSRRWPRISSPKELAVEFLIPDAELTLHCPESRNWEEVALPELREGLDSKSLASLVESFKAKASEMASEGRVIMFKEKGPSDIAEEIASSCGRALYVPSTLADLPLADPYPSGRIVTRDMAAEFDSPSAQAQGSRLGAFLRGRALKGVASCLWSPVLYYQYAVGLVYMANGPERPQALDYGAVDLAWEFSRVLAWFLKRHGYFAAADTNSGPRKGGIIDASPAGLLAALQGLVKDDPAFALGSVLRLRLGIKGRNIVCSGRIARRFEEGNSIYCGIAFMDLSAQDMASLSLHLYGSDDAPSGGSEHEPG